MGQYAHLATRPCLTMRPIQKKTTISMVGARTDKEVALISVSDSISER